MPHEIEILLKTAYKGESFAKVAADLDKISASGNRLTGVMSKVNKTLGGDIFKNASPEFMRRNPHLFQQQASGAIMQSDNYLRQGAKNLLRMGAFTPRGGAVMQSDAFLASGAKSLLGMGPLNGGGHSLMSDKFLAQGAKRALSMGSLFYNGPAPPVIPPKPGFLSQAGGAFGGRFGIGAAAISGGAAGVTAFLAYEALQLAIKGITKALMGFINAVDGARQLYAKSLTSGGIGIGFTSRREALASVLGVSSKDVYQFGQAVLFLSPKLEWASGVLAKTNPDVTALGWSFAILGKNIEALFSTLAADAAPALRRFADGLSNIIKVITSFFQNPVVAMLINSSVGAWIGGSIIGGKDSGSAPNPLSYMKQIQASAWERMGLVIGGMGGGSPAQETARNTKETATGIKQLVRAFGLKGGSFYDPFAGAQSYQ